MVASMSGTAYYAYRFVTSEQFKARVMNEVLDNAMPDMTGGTVPEFIPPSPNLTR